MIFDKVYNFFRYDLYRGISNLFRFLKPVWNYRSWDYHYTLVLFKSGLKHLYNNFEKYSMEIDKTRLLKVEKMKRALFLLNVINNDLFLNEAEKILNIKYTFGKIETIPNKKEGMYDVLTLDSGLTKEQIKNNHMLLNKTNKLEDEYWKELWDIIKGNGYFYYSYQNNKEKQNKIEFDGTDIRGWWD